MPRSGIYRLMLPADADWTEAKKQDGEEDKDDVEKMLTSDDIREKREQRDQYIRDNSVLKTF